MKKSAHAFFVFLFFALGSSVHAKQLYVDSLYSGVNDLKNLTDQGFEVAGVDLERSVVTLLMDEEDLVLTRSLDIIGTRTLVAPDSQYKKPTDIEKILAATEEKYPGLAKIEVIGTSNEGRKILAAHLTNHSNRAEKLSVVFDAMHHAREVMTPEVALDIVDYLTSNYQTDAQVKKWMDSYDVWVVPMLNPDGNNKVWTKSSMWRKNTRGGYGVDINRNYPFAWNTCNGSSGNKNADDYRGDKEGSEPETNALMDLVKKVNPMFNVSYHSFSEIVIYPFGCKPKHIPESHKAIYEGIGKELAKTLVRDSGSGTYTAGTSYELLYSVDGGSIDWIYNQDKTMAFVIEMNSTSQGFQPSYKNWRDKTIKKQRPGWMYILNRMSGPGIK